jgi:hypothetical protein
MNSVKIKKSLEKNRDKARYKIKGSVLYWKKENKRKKQRKRI